MRTAIVHDWLVTYGGAERVLEDLLAVFPDADLFSLIDFLPDDQRGFLGGRTPRTSFLRRLPLARSHYRSYLPLMPLAAEQFDLARYDLVLSSSYAVAKGVITGPHQLHVSYVHSPMRYAWDLQHAYLRQAGLRRRGPRSLVARGILHYLRLWDARTANGVDHIIANSAFVARRVRKVYRRSSTVVHPPVDLDAFPLRRDKEDFYVTASRLVPYKRIDLVVEAFRAMPDRRLVVIGDGPEAERIRSLAGDNVEVLGYQPLEVLRDHLQRARAFVFAAEEDFGIAPLEAQACGTPVIAYGRGGALETVRDVDEPNPTGLFFEQRDVEGIVAAVERFEERRACFEPCAIRRHAERFGRERFRHRIRELIDGWMQRA